VNLLCRLFGHRPAGPFVLYRDCAVFRGGPYFIEGVGNGRLHVCVRYCGRCGMSVLWGADRPEFPSLRHWLVLIGAAVAVGLLLVWVAA
jgi:hypothetical protein